MIMKKDGEEPLPLLWARHFRCPTIRSGNALMERYMGFVEEVARSIHWHLPYRWLIEVEELIAWGSLGLRDAIGWFDRTRGIKFEAYAYTRVRGSILDGLRIATWLPHRSQTRRRKIEKEEERLLSCLGRRPLEIEMKEATGFSDLSISHFFRISKDKGYVCGHGFLSSSLTPLDQLIAEEELSFPVNLTPKIRSILNLRYRDNLTIQEIAKRLGFSRDYASREHRKALFEIGMALRKRESA